MIGILVGLIVIGLILYLVNTYLPLPRPIIMIINVIAVLFLIIWLAQTFLGGSGSPNFNLR